MAKGKKRRVQRNTKGFKVVVDEFETDTESDSKEKKRMEILKAA